MVGKQDRDRARAIGPCREVRRRDRGEPRAARGLRRADPVGGNSSQPVHRLRQGVRDREGRRSERPLAARGRPRGGCGGEHPRRGARLPHDGQAARLSLFAQVLRTRIKMKPCAAGTCCAARCFVLGRPDMFHIGAPCVLASHSRSTPRRRTVILIRVLSLSPGFAARWLNPR